MIVAIAYFVAAHVALLLAMITVVRDPASTFVFLQPSVAGTVHLVTLGWITGTILGAVYVVGPLALRLRLDVRRLDYVALGVYLIGASGLVAYFWIQEYSGMAGSAAMVWIAVVLVLGRVWDAMHEKPLDRRRVDRWCCHDWTHQPDRHDRCRLHASPETSTRPVGTWNHGCPLMREQQ